MTILDQIIENKKTEVARAKEKVTIEELKSFYQTLGKEGLISVFVRVLELAGGKLYEGYSRAG